MARARPTISQIAKLSDTSRGTVDRVVNNRPNVNPDKALRIAEVMARLGYRPRSARARLRGARPYRIGVVMPDWPGWFGSALAEGIEEAACACRAGGGEVALRRSASHLAIDTAEAISSFADEGVAGMAVCAHGGPAVREALLAASARGIPVVTFAQDVPGSGRSCHVGQDWEKGGRIAAGIMAKMIRPGDRVLVLAGNLESTPQRGRAEGFRNYWAGLGRAAGDCLLEPSYDSFEVTFEKTIAALERDTALCSVYMAGEGLPACVEAIGSLALPRPIRVAAHEASEENRRLLQYGAVDFVIHQYAHFLGRRPVELLAALANGRAIQSEIEFAPMSIVTAESVQ